MGIAIRRKTFTTVQLLHARVRRIDAGRSVPAIAAVPPYRTFLSRISSVLKTKTILGQFASPEQAVVFVLTGAVYQGNLTLGDVLRYVGLGKRCGMLDLNEQQIIQLLVHHHVVTRNKYETCEVLIEDASEVEIDCTDELEAL
jgi:hypothetical protein